MRVGLCAFTLTLLQTISATYFHQFIHIAYTHATVLESNMFGV